MCASFEIAGCFLFIASYNRLQKNISVYEWHLYHPRVAYLANTLHPSLRVVERFNARVYFESQEKYSADSEMRFTADEDVPLVVISPMYSTMCKKVYRKDIRIASKSNMRMRKIFSRGFLFKFTEIVGVFFLKTDLYTYSYSILSKYINIFIVSLLDTWNTIFNWIFLSE